MAEMSREEVITRLQTAKVANGLFPEEREGIIAAIALLQQEEEKRESAIERARRFVMEIPKGNSERHTSMLNLGWVTSDEWLDGVHDTLIALVEAVEDMSRSK